MQKIKNIEQSLCCKIVLFIWQKIIFYRAKTNNFAFKSQIFIVQNIFKLSTSLFLYRAKIFFLPSKNPFLIVQKYFSYRAINSHPKKINQRFMYVLILLCRNNVTK